MSMGLPVAQILVKVPLGGPEILTKGGFFDMFFKSWLVNLFEKPFEWNFVYARKDFFKEWGKSFE